MFDPSILAAPATSSMRRTAQFQQFDCGDLQAENPEGVGYWGAIGDGLGKNGVWVKRSARCWPSPKGSTFGPQLFPMLQAALPEQVCFNLPLPTPKSKLTPGLWQEPAKFNPGVVLELSPLGTALIGQQLKGVAIEPAPIHESAHAWAPICSDGGELQPSAHRGSTFSVASCLQERSPGGKIFSSLAHCTRNVTPITAVMSLLIVLVS